MTTPEERDYIGEVIREDAATRCAVIGAQNVNSAMSTIDALRQQLADVSNERDGLRVDRDRIKSLFAALETDAALLDYLQDQLVDTIYLDDGRIIDIAGRVTLREGVRTHMSTPTPLSAEVQS